MIGLSRLIRAIADVPKGGMQTGGPKVVLKLADAERIKAELEGVISERDALAKEVCAANDRNAELVEERDALAAQNKILLDAVNLAIPSAEICYNLDLATFETLFLMREAVKATPQQCLADIKSEAIAKFLHVLEHAPGSPVSAMTALGISQWWDNLNPPSAISEMRVDHGYKILGVYYARHGGNLTSVVAAVGRAGFIAGAEALEVAQILSSDFDVEKSADEYAATVRQGGAE